MSYDFSNKQCIKTIDTSEKIKLGTFVLNESAQIGYAQLSIFIQGSISGPEQMRLNVYSDSGYTALRFYSDKINLNQITYDTSKGWRGEVLFTFGRQNLNKNFSHYFELECFNYTRNGNTFYLGVCKEYLDPHFNSGGSLATPIDNACRLGIFRYA